MEQALTEAAAREAKYDWTTASELYQQALRDLDSEKDPKTSARLTELLARSVFNASFQSETPEQFKNSVLQARDFYQTTSQLYERAAQPGQSERFQASSAYASFWQCDTASERRNLLEKCTALAKNAVEMFEKQGEQRLLAETRQELATYFTDVAYWSKERETKFNYFELAGLTSSRAAEEFETLGDNENQLVCLNQAIHGLLMARFHTPEEAKLRGLLSKAETLTRQIEGIAERTGTPYTKALLERALGLLFLAQGDRSRALEHWKAGVERAEETRDNYLTGQLLRSAASGASWAAWLDDDIEQRKQLATEGQALAPRALKLLEGITAYQWIPWTLGDYAECFTTLAARVETDAERKRMHLRKAIEIATEGGKWEEWPFYYAFLGHALSKAQYYLASITSDTQEKARLLESALHLREAAVREPDMFGAPWNRGADHNYLALVKAELSNLSRDSKVKSDLLQSAVSDMKNCVNLLSNFATNPGDMVTLAGYEESYGDILLKLHRISKDPHTAQEAQRIYEQAIASLNKSGHTAPIGGVRWKIATAYDAIGDHRAASEAFRQAAEDYRLGSKKIPSSEPVFTELASYMEAWSLIEEARLHHNDEHYEDAAKSYGNVTVILERAQGHSYLSSHYAACKLLELGEGMSRAEKPEEAEEYFASAVRSFDEARLELERKLTRVRGLEGKELEDWIAITLDRERYCGGRIKLEKAKLLDRQGEKEASSTAYYSASEVFRALAKASQTEQARRELDTLRLFCEAWSKMKEADAKAAPEIYGEAVELFVRTEKTAAREKMRLLARANSSICRALASGTLFRRTRDTGLYSEIKKQLEAASDYYQEGDFGNQAEWTRATGRMFDALVYLADAESEKELKKKTELFHLAEKHLELAAKLYGQAGFSKKREEALRHLDKAREEKELLLAPLDALSGNPSSYSSVTPVTLVRDQSLGLKRFEGSHVVGNLGLPENEIGVGAGIVVELEISNLGRTPAMLLKLENISPSGLELERDRITEKVKDGHIDLKGRRLEYLKTHDVKIPLKAVRKGTFELRPRVDFVDDKGNPGSFEFGPASITVKELGISDWLKGPK